MTDTLRERLKQANIELIGAAKHHAAINEAIDALSRPAIAGCGACGDGCKDRAGGCRIAEDSPPALPEPTLLYVHRDDGVTVYGYTREQMLSRPAIAPQGEAVDWQVWHPQDGWMHTHANNVAGYRGLGLPVRPLYATPQATPPAAVDDAMVRIACVRFFGVSGYSDYQFNEMREAMKLAAALAAPPAEVNNDDLKTKFPILQGEAPKKTGMEHAP